MTPSPSSSTSRTADSPLGTATCGAAVSRTSRPCPAAVVDARTVMAPVVAVSSTCRPVGGSRSVRGLGPRRARPRKPLPDRSTSGVGPATPGHRAAAFAHLDRQRIQPHTNVYGPASIEVAISET